MNGSSSKAMTPEEVLHRLRVPTTRNWYMVGHGARRVTVRTQQVRALNLAWALLEASGAKHQRIVVIGGGVAGLTVSAALATCGATVTVLERHAQLVPLQRNCTKRHLHPHVFDWPDPISENTDADLPILNWRADWAREVAITIEDGFKSCESRSDSRLQHRCYATNIELDSPAAGRLTLCHSAAQIREAIDYDILIFALGFGVETTVLAGSRGSYWADDSLDQHGVIDGGQYLVSVRTPT